VPLGLKGLFGSNEGERGWRFWRPRRPLVRDALVRHMGGPCADAETVAHNIKPIERVNLQQALDRWVAGNGRPAGLIGYTLGSFFSNAEIAQLLLDNVVQAPVQREQFESSPEQFLDCVTRGLYLLHHDGRPVAVLLSQPESRFDTPRLEVMAMTRQVARAALQKLLDETNQALVYRGRSIYLEEEPMARQVVVRFHKLAPTPRDALVLPEKIMAVIERNVLGLFRHADRLRRAGRSTRYGLLFHGPPGTGKTLMLRYLAGACPDHTVILMSGRQMSLIRESCQVARLLAPSLVLLEDVDLIAQDRSDNSCPALLQELMDEMDGLGPKADIIFLLTTNRPEVLEPALSARPGRIDQAIEFPLPDEECRRRLCALYGRGLDLSGLDLPRWIARTEGVSPAFIEELLRKSALLAAERGEDAEPLPLRDDDVHQAMEELVCFGGELTQKLLGYRPFGFARR
jgi:SpoVK/Ycf46/Vps4 family AAA+-type ATPase